MKKKQVSKTFSEPLQDAEVYPSDRIPGEGWMLFSELGHLILKARAISQRANPEIASFGAKTLAELQRLCHRAQAPSTGREERAFYARLSPLISEGHNRKDEAGRFARRLLREMDSLLIPPPVTTYERRAIHVD